MEESKDNTIEDYDDNLGINPFLASFRIEAWRAYTNKEFYHADEFMPDEHEIEAVNNIAGTVYSKTYFWVEKQTPSRVYGFKWIRDNVFTIDNNALRLFLFIVAHIGKNKHRIRIYRNKYMESAQISLKTYYNALDKLKKGGVLSQYKPNIFWVNPAIIFRGSRISCFEEKIREIGQFVIQKRKEKK